MLCVLDVLAQLLALNTTLCLQQEGWCSKACSMAGTAIRNANCLTAMLHMGVDKALQCCEAVYALMLLTRRQTG